jgi:DNA-binding protein HU-beta
MNQGELAAQVAMSADVPAQDASRILEAFEQAIRSHLAAGHRVELRGFGSFSKGIASVKAGRDPRTGAPITYTSYRRATNLPEVGELQLEQEIAQAAGADTAAVGRVIDAYKGSVKSSLKKGGMVSLRGFGTYYVGRRSARSVRLPGSTQVVRVAAARVPKYRASHSGALGYKFTPSQVLKDAVN